MAVDQSIKPQCMLLTRACAVCQASFETSKYNRIYCSQYCYKRAWYLKQAPRPDRSCERCGRPVDTTVRSDRRFCSAGCMRAAYYQRQGKVNAKRRYDRTYKPRLNSYPPKACAGCGAEFSPKRIDSAYCTPKCFFLVHKHTPERRRRVRAMNAAREAKKRGVESVVFDAVSVLERDG